MRLLQELVFNLVLSLAQLGLDFPDGLRVFDNHLLHELRSDQLSLEIVVLVLQQRHRIKQYLHFLILLLELQL